MIKFERDYQQQLTYEFIRSFPLSISSMPVSFDASSLLKVTVSMSYIRYIVLKTPSKTGSGGGSNNPAERFNPSSQANSNSRQLSNLYNPSINPDSSFRRNINRVTPDDARLIQEEANFTLL